MPPITEGPWQSQHDFDRDGLLTIIGAIDGPDGGHNDFHYTTVCVVEEGEDATANAQAIAALTDLVSALTDARAALLTAYPLMERDKDASPLRLAADKAGAALIKAGIRP